MAAVPEWLKRVTDDWSTDRFHPEFDDFKYNHIYQGVVALWQIGANEDQCRHYAETDSKHLDPAEVGKERVETGRKLLSESTLKDLLGKRTRYNDLVAHFRQRLVHLGDDIGLLINKELPALLPSIGHPAFHGFIQLGYGYLANDERLLCEGFAYLHFAYLPCVLSGTPVSDKGDADTDILDILKEVKEDGKLSRFANDKRIHFNDGRDGNEFLSRIYTLITLKGDDLVTLANRIELPDWFDKSNCNAEKLRKLSEWILDKTIVVYCMSEMRNNFFLLHGVTSAWALCQILPLLTDPQQALHTIQHYLAALLATYVAIECPALSMENLAGLEDVSWETILQKNLEIKGDAHMHKLVHACCVRNKENQDKDMGEVYRQAAQLVTYYPYT